MLLFPFLPFLTFQEDPTKYKQQLEQHNKNIEIGSLLEQPTLVKTL